MWQQRIVHFFRAAVAATDVIGAAAGVLALLDCCRQHSTQWLLLEHSTCLCSRETDTLRQQQQRQALCSAADAASVSSRFFSASFHIGMCYVAISFCVNTLPSHTCMCSTVPALPCRRCCRARRRRPERVALQVMRQRRPGRQAAVLRALPRGVPPVLPGPATEQGAAGRLAVPGLCCC